MVLMDEQNSYTCSLHYENLLLRFLNRDFKQFNKTYQILSLISATVLSKSMSRYTNIICCPSILFLNLHSPCKLASTHSPLQGLHTIWAPKSYSWQILTTSSFFDFFTCLNTVKLYFPSFLILLGILFLFLIGPAI